ncbi:MAG TPA: hypothetical protein DCQ98_19235 [Planctomycetaceae bacterium]|nr:hypothetical protein [Planctomycetaceae bacterium]HRE99283.1 hypothetical protein [Pirellulaceae bacterium]
MTEPRDELASRNAPLDDDRIASVIVVDPIDGDREAGGAETARAHDPASLDTLPPAHDSLERIAAEPIGDSGPIPLETVDTIESVAVSATTPGDEDEVPLAEAIAPPVLSSPASIEAELVSPAIEPIAAATPLRRYRSWPFRMASGIGRAIEFSFGGASLIVLLAIATGIPGAQILTLGYLIEVSGRIARTGKVRAGMPGWRKAARIGSLALGTLMCLAPIGYLSSLAEAAELIDPTSTSSRGLRIGQWIVTLMLVPHMLAAWFCGGKLRYFFWPLLAPFQLAIWALQWTLASPALRRGLDRTLGEIWPTLVADLCAVTPLTDFFLPAIIGKHLWQGTLWARLRDGFWEFLAGLRLPYLGWLGLRAFVGSVAWLCLPTLLLIGGTALPDGGAVLTGTTGVVLLAIVCLYLPVLQTHFGAVGKLFAMFDLVEARRQIARSPLRHSIALLLVMVLALPLYLFKIELLDGGIWWALGLIFVAFSLPARWVTGWAYARSSRRETKSWLIWRWPIRMAIFPLAIIFAIFVSVTRFLSWGGALGLFEHHAFLVPAPFTRLF